jgi:hypothetical protein
MHCTLTKNLSDGGTLGFFLLLNIHLLRCDFHSFIYIYATFILSFTFMRLSYLHLHSYDFHSRYALIDGSNNDDNTQKNWKSRAVTQGRNVECDIFDDSIQADKK